MKKKLRSTRKTDSILATDRFEAEVWGEHVIRR